MEPLEISARAYGRPFARGLGLLLPVVVVAPAAAFVLLPERAAELTMFVPVMSVPALAVFVFMVLGLRSRPVAIRLHGGVLRVTGWRRRGTIEGRVSAVEVVPWIVPGLGVARGAAVSVRLDGRPAEFSVAVAGQAAPAGASRNTSHPDCFVDAASFSSLVAALRVKSASVPPDARESTFSVVRYGGWRAGLGGMVWWLGTMGFLGVFGTLFGERLARDQAGLALVLLVSLISIGFGMAKTFAHFRRGKPAYELAIVKGAVRLRDTRGGTVWAAGQGTFRAVRETYVYRTKYGSHRFPVLVLAGPEGSRPLRLGVWDTQARWQDAQAPTGGAPNYLIGSPDWDRLVEAIG